MAKELHIHITFFPEFCGVSDCGLLVSDTSVFTSINSKMVSCHCPFN